MDITRLSGNYFIRALEPADLPALLTLCKGEPAVLPLLPSVPFRNHAPEGYACATARKNHGG